MRRRNRSASRARRPPCLLHHPPQGGEGVLGRRSLHQRAPQRLGPGRIPVQHGVLLGGEVVEKGSGGHVGPVGDGLHRHARQAPLLGQAEGGLVERLPGSLLFALAARMSRVEPAYDDLITIFARSVKTHSVQISRRGQRGSLEGCSRVGPVPFRSCAGSSPSSGSHPPGRHPIPTGFAPRSRRPPTSLAANGPDPPAAHPGRLAGGGPSATRHTGIAVPAYVARPPLTASAPRPTASAPNWPAWTPSWTGAPWSCRRREQEEVNAVLVGPQRRLLGHRARPAGHGPGRGAT